MKRLKPWPIILGILIDSLGTVAAGLLYFLIVFAILILRGTPAVDESFEMPYFDVVELCGLLLPFLGGYVSARLAGVLYVQHGLAVGVGSFLLWLFVDWVGSPDSIGMWYDVALLTGGIPAGALGGYVAARRARKTMPAPTGINGASNQP